MILLSGEMGAGKTQSVRWLVEALGGNSAQVSSPTFSIHNRYPAPSGPIDHVDLFRLSSDQDLESSGFWDLLTNAQGLVIVEWADRLPDEVWPKTWSRHFIHIEKDAADLNSRSVTYKKI